MIDTKLKEEEAAERDQEPTAAIRAAQKARLSLTRRVEAKETEVVPGHSCSRP